MSGLVGAMMARVFALLRRSMPRPMPGLPACIVSIGIASRQKQDARIEDIRARADAARYRAKQAGRNRVEPERADRAPTAAGSATLQPVP